MGKQILHSIIEGEGKPLLILHGYFGMSDNWKTLGNRFSQDFEVHLIDQRNHGRSFHEAEFNYQVLSDDLFNYIQSHNLEKVCLIGHSMGGKTAMFFATQHASLVEKLIVADISPRYYQPHHNAILAALNSVDFSKHNSRKLVDSQLQELIPELGVRQFLMKNIYWKSRGVLDFRFNLKVLTEKNENVGEALPKDVSFEGETLFIKGGKSNYITEAETPMINTYFPNAILKEIPKVGHWLHAENPDAFYELAIEFLT